MSTDVLIAMVLGGVLGFLLGTSVQWEKIGGDQ